jgi:hypothetical protein
MTRNLRNAFLFLAASTLAACGNAGSKGTIGPSGGSLRTASGVTLSVAAGALTTETQIEIVDAAPRHGEHRRIQLEPRGLKLSGKATVTVVVDDSKGPVKLVEVETEHGAEGEVEVEHALETEHGVEVETEHGREAEIDHLGELEVRDAAPCDPVCADGLECDDGLCKAHHEDPAGTDDPPKVDDSTPPATDPGTPPATTCPAGQELDPSDGTCKVHGGGSGGGNSGSGSGK